MTNKILFHYSSEIHRQMYEQLTIYTFNRSWSYYWWSQIHKWFGSQRQRRSRDYGDIVAYILPLRTGATVTLPSSHILPKEWSPSHRLSLVSYGGISFVPCSNPQQCNRRPPEVFPLHYIMRSIKKRRNKALKGSNVADVSMRNKGWSPSIKWLASVRDTFLSC